MGLSAAGQSGALEWGYHVAGTLGAWTLTRADDAWSLSARIIVMDEFKASQRPLIFVATHAKGAWRWPVESLEIQDGALTARLGPKES